jgi:hypothetical protein
MQIDGVTGIEINRYYMSIDFLTEVTDDETVVAGVEQAVAWASTQLDFFPLRAEDVTPQAMREIYTSDHTRTFSIAFNSFVIAYPPSSTQAGQMDHVAFAEQTYKLTVLLCAVNGILECELRFAALICTVDTRYNSVSTVCDRALRILRDAKQDGMKGIFPFAASAEELKFTIKLDVVT